MRYLLLLFLLLSAPCYAGLIIQGAAATGCSPVSNSFGPEAFTVNDGAFTTLAGTPTVGGGVLTLDDGSEGVTAEVCLERGFTVSFKVSAIQSGTDTFNYGVASLFSGANSYKVYCGTSVDAEDVLYTSVSVSENGVDLAVAQLADGYFDAAKTITVYVEADGDIIVKNGATTLLSTSDSTYTLFDTFTLTQEANVTTTVIFDDVSVGDL